MEPSRKCTTCHGSPLPAQSGHHLGLAFSPCFRATQTSLQTSSPKFVTSGQLFPTQTAFPSHPDVFEVHHTYHSLDKASMFGLAGQKPFPLWSYIFGPVCLSHSPYQNLPTVLLTFCYCCCLVTHSCSALCNSMDCSPPGSSVRGVSQARILERVAISFSRGSFQLRD